MEQQKANQEGRTLLLTNVPKKMTREFLQQRLPPITGYRSGADRYHANRLIL